MFDVINLSFAIRFRGCPINETEPLSGEEDRKIAPRAVHGKKKRKNR